MLELETMYLIIIGLLTVHLFFFLGFQYQVLQLLDELAFPSDDPIMTSTLFAHEEELEEEPEQTVEEWDEPEEEEPEEEEPEPAEELEEEVEEEPEREVFKPTKQTPKQTPKLSILYEVGDYTPSGEATLRQLKGMRKDDLIGICDMHGLDTDGTKADLIERIVEMETPVEGEDHAPYDPTMFSTTTL